MASKISGFIDRVDDYRVAATSVLVLTIVLSVIGINQIEINSNMDLFTAKDSEYMATLVDLENSFSNRQLTVMLTFDAERFGLRELIKSMSVIQKASTLSSFNTEVMPKFDPTQLFKLQDKGLASDDMIKIMGDLGPLSPLSFVKDSVYFRVDLPIRDSLIIDDLHAIEEHLKGLEVTYHLAGDDYMQLKLFDYIKAILLFMPPLAIGSIFLVFSWQMGSIKTTVFSVLPAVVAAIWIMGLVGHFGESVSIITVLAPIYTLIIGSADGLHFVSHFQEAIAKQGDRKVALVETLDMVGMPLIVTTLTSIVGFMSLLIIGESIISTLAIISSIGIGLAAIATWWILPLIFLSGVKLKPIGHRNEKLLIGLKKVWGKRIVALVLLFMVITALGLPLLKTDFNQLMFYKKSTELYQSFNTISEATGGGVPVIVRFSWPSDESAASVSGIIESELSQLKEVNRILGLSGLEVSLKSLKTRAPELPEMFAPDVNIAKQFIDEKKGLGRILVFPKEINDDSLDAIENKALGLPKAYDVRVTGFQYVMKDLNEIVISNQLLTQFLALTLVFLFLLMAVKKIRAALVALVPMVVTMYLAYGYLAFLKIPLNLFTILMFSISIGIGIDYAIHFTSVWMAYRYRSKTNFEAMDLAFNYTSRPIIANALGLAIGMSAMMLSPLRVHVYLSLVMWFTMITSSLLTLTLLPTLLRRFKD